MAEGSTQAAAGVCVIIAAYDSATTIARAVASALAQPEAAEVIVVDDGSTDSTADVARTADDGSGRLSILQLPTNVGPSRARNLAIDRSRAAFIAVLDADDFFLPDRFAALLALPEWEMIADDIAFVNEADVNRANLAVIAAHPVAARALSATAFIRGCLTRPDRYKGELGFLKPVMSRAFLDRHGLRYREELRLSEDLDLYARALMASARFRIAPVCRYVAVERAGSLSARHGVGELLAAEHAVAALLAAAPGGSDVAVELRRLHAQAVRKRRLRAVLARKAQAGTWTALREEARGAMTSVLTDIARDKLRTARDRLFPRSPRPAGPRFLL